MTDLEPHITIGEIGESGILGLILDRLAEGASTSSAVALGPGDDAAYVRTGAGVLASTDAMVSGQDWLDHWSGAADVGAKVAVQNLADIAAMGGICTALLLTVVAPPSTAVRWVSDLVDGLAETAHRAGVRVVGGDLSSGQQRMISVTALGDLADGVPGPVVRSGAKVGEVVAISGISGRSAAGLHILRRSDEGRFPPPEHAPQCAEWVEYHCRPTPDLSQGPAAARAGATALIDVSDGLLRDVGRVATASKVRIRLDSAPLAPWIAALAQVLGDSDARTCVLYGGEEHVLVGTFAADTVPPSWTTIGSVDATPTGFGHVLLDNAPAPSGGWDHFEN